MLPQVFCWPQVKPELSYPVLVFFHGGSYEIGAAAQYTPEYFLDKDIVLVVVQFRVGLFGEGPTL